MVIASISTQNTAVRGDAVSPCQHSLLILNQNEGWPVTITVAFVFLYKVSVQWHILWAQICLLLFSTNAYVDLIHQGQGDQKDMNYTNSNIDIFVVSYLAAFNHFNFMLIILGEGGRGGGGGGGGVVLSIAFDEG